MFLGPLIALAVVVLVAALALCSGHIPGLRALTGAAPLQPEDRRPACTGCVGCGGPDCIERGNTPGEVTEP